MWLSLFSAFALSVSTTATDSNPPSGFTVQNLRCENQLEPLGIDTLQPRFSWTPANNGTGRSKVQTAYRILASSTPELLAKNKGDLWDSGRVDSSDQNNLPYKGIPLKSCQICNWKVQIWLSGSSPSWSKPSHWEMGLIRQQDWTGKWINDGKPNPSMDAEFYKNDPAPLFRKEFTLTDSVKSARLYLAGLGYCEVTLNGNRISDRVLEPGWTKFDKRVLTSVYDVTHKLTSALNCLGIQLGNGWYNPLPLRLFGSFDLRKQLAVSRPRILAQLRIEYQDGTVQTISTDKTWQVGSGPILRNNIYLGEVVDARKEQDGWDKPGFIANGWTKPGLASEPIGQLKAPHQPPIRATSTWNPVKVTEPKSGVFIYDFGINFAGWPRLQLNAPSGTEIHLRYGELLNKDGTLNPMTSVAGQIKGFRQGTTESVGGPGAPKIAWQADTYISRGGQEIYTPKFTFHGFRYMEVSGLPTALPINNVTAMRLNSDVEPVGSFECSNPLLNDIQAMCVRTFKSNIFSVQSDCPHRERLGYGGDIVATSDAFLSNFDMSGFYAKVVEDFTDSALPDGMFTDTAPYIGIQYCGVVWAMAHPLLVDRLYQYYGDRRMAQQQFGAAKKWVQLVERQYPDGIVTDGLSDHEALVSAPSAESVTPMYYLTARIMASIAGRLALKNDQTHFTQLADKIQAAYQGRFVDAATGRVGPGTQASQAIALYTRIVPVDTRKKVLQYLLTDIEGHHGHLTTGILGTKFMLDVLSREGYADVAYRIATQTDFPGWGWMLKNGATTLWEHWAFSDNTFSHNHPMFGSVSQWMIQWLGGIQPASESTGFDRIVVSPQTPNGLNWVKCSYRSIRGKITSNWSRQGSQIKFEIEIPVNASAQIILPAKSIERVAEGNHPLNEAHGIQKISFSNSTIRLTVGSGHYSFVTDDIHA